MIASKGRFDRAKSSKRRSADGLPHRNPWLSTDEFMEATLDVWDIAAENATRIGHPAPFPVELPQRLIHLYTYEDDLVLDPFVGSGTTAVAAVRGKRRYVGYDTEKTYIDLAKKRVSEEWRRTTQALWRVTLPTIHITFRCVLRLRRKTSKLEPHWKARHIKASQPWFLSGADSR